MKIPWFKKKRDNQVDKKKDKERKLVFKLNNKSYLEESLSNESKEIIRQIKRSDEIINNQKNKIQLLKNAQKTVIGDLKKNLIEID